MSTKDPSPSAVRRRQPSLVAELTTYMPAEEVRRRTRVDSQAFLRARDSAVERVIGVLRKDARPRGA